MNKERVCWIAFCVFIFLGCELRIRFSKEYKDQYSIPVVQQDNYEDVFGNEVYLHMVASKIDTSEQKEQKETGSSYQASDVDAGKEAEENEQDPYMRGYITGYHRALELQSCPR